MSTTVSVCFFFQAEDGIRDVERSRGLGDVYKRQLVGLGNSEAIGKKTIDRVTITECKQVTDGMTSVE